MNTKLTLNINKLVVERGKAYAKRNRKSLSKLVEAYLTLLSDKSNDIDEPEISPKVRSLMGSIKLTEQFNYKEEMSKALSEKYLK